MEGGKKAGSFLQLVSKFGIRHLPYPKEKILIASQEEKISHPALVSGRNSEEFLQKLKQKKYIAGNALSLKLKTVVSDTGELFLNAANEIFIAVAERAEVPASAGKKRSKRKRSACPQTDLLMRHFSRVLWKGYLFPKAAES